MKLVHSALSVIALFTLLVIPVSFAFFGLNVGRTLQKVSGINPFKLLFRTLFGIDVTFDPETPTPLPFPTSLTTPSIPEVKHFVYYAAASYCQGVSLSDWTCSECKATGPTVQMVQVLRNDPADTQGYIAVDPSRQEIVVVYRGSHNPKNFIQDLTLDFIASPFGDGSRVHKGFLEATMSLYPQVLPIVKNLVNQHSGWRVVVTGHSLGGSMATLTYYLLSHDVPDVNYAVFTQGEPRTGDKAFADIINARNIPFARLVNEGDFVPHGCAASLGFVHHQTEYWTDNGVTRICSREFYEDPTCSNSLEKTNEENAEDHLTYMDISIGLNCLIDNPIGQAWAMLTGK